MELERGIYFLGKLYIYFGGNILVMLMMEDCGVNDLKMHRGEKSNILVEVMVDGGISCEETLHKSWW